jgi:hypothetical protein
VSSFVSRLSPEERRLYEEVKALSLKDMSHELACMATIKAFKEPEDLRIVSAASGVVLGAARVADLERDDGESEGDSAVTIVVRRSGSSEG